MFPQQPAFSRPRGRVRKETGGPSEKNLCRCESEPRGWAKVPWGAAETRAAALAGPFRRMVVAFCSLCLSRVHRFLLVINCSRRLCALGIEPVLLWSSESFAGWHKHSSRSCCTGRWPRSPFSGHLLKQPNKRANKTDPPSVGESKAFYFSSFLVIWHFPETFSGYHLSAWRQWEPELCLSHTRTTFHPCHTPPCYIQNAVLLTFMPPFISIYMYMFELYISQLHPYEKYREKAKHWLYI